jgi:hypothetical protein
MSVAEAFAHLAGLLGLGEMAACRYYFVASTAYPAVYPLRLPAFSASNMHHLSNMECTGGVRAQYGNILYYISLIAEMHHLE